MKKFIITMLMIASPAYATNYYVDYVGGNDANNPGTMSAPRRTIPGTLAAGDIVYLKRGVTYGDLYSFANSGTTKTSGTNGSFDSTGSIFTVAGETFQTKGVSPGDLIYINGSGLYTISSVNSQTQITLTQAVPYDKGMSGLDYVVATYITITLDPNWGTGNVGVTNFNVSGRSNIRINGVVSNGFEFNGIRSQAVYGSGSCSNIILQNLYIHDGGNGNAGAIYLQSVTYALTENIYIKNWGSFGTGQGGRGIQMVSSSQYGTVSRAIIDRTAEDGVNFANCNKCYVQGSEIMNNVEPVVHSDGIQCNTGTGTMDVTVRYTKLHDNANQMMLEGANLTFYNNLVYRTGQPGNYGMQAGGPVYGGSTVSFYIYNNIFMNNVYAAMRLSNTATVVVKNNVFFDSNSGGSNYACVPGVPGTFDYNIYIRKAESVDGDAVTVNPATGAKITLAQAKALGSDLHSKKCTAAGCDWAWQSPKLFTNETFATPNFTTAASNSPQVDAGVTITGIPALDFILTSRPQGSSWDVGSYEYIGGGTAPTGGSTPLIPGYPGIIQIK